VQQAAAANNKILSRSSGVTREYVLRESPRLSQQ